LTTNKVIATGDLGKYKVPRGSQEPVILPVTFSYAALNATDITWNNMYAACGHLWPGTVRPGMSFSYFHSALSLSLFLFRFGVVKSMMADGRYEIEIGSGIVNRWID
jgi:hypothetical protein